MIISKAQSITKQMKNKKQYRSNQGRSPKQEEQTYQTLRLAFILFTICICGYLFVKIWM